MCRCLAYSDNRLNVLFFVVFVVIGNMYDYGTQPSKTWNLSVQSRDLLDTEHHYCRGLSCFPRLFLEFHCQLAITTTHRDTSVVRSAEKMHTSRRISRTQVRNEDYRLSNIAKCRFVPPCREKIPIFIVQKVVNAASMTRWHSERINQVCETITYRSLELLSIVS